MKPETSKTSGHDTIPAPPGDMTVQPTAAARPAPMCPSPIGADTTEKVFVDEEELAWTLSALDDERLDDHPET